MGDDRSEVKKKEKRLRDIPIFQVPKKRGLTEGQGGVKPQNTASAIQSKSARVPARKISLKTNFGRSKKFIYHSEK